MNESTSSSAEEAALLASLERLNTRLVGSRKPSGDFDAKTAQQKSLKRLTAHPTLQAARSLPVQSVSNSMEQMNIAASLARLDGRLTGRLDGRLTDSAATELAQRSQRSTAKRDIEQMQPLSAPMGAWHAPITCCAS